MSFLYDSIFNPFGVPTQQLIAGPVADSVVSLARYAPSKAFKLIIDKVTLDQPAWVDLLAKPIQFIIVIKLPYEKGALALLI